MNEHNAKSTLHEMHTALSCVKYANIMTTTDRQQSRYEEFQLAKRSKNLRRKCHFDLIDSISKMIDSISKMIDWFFPMSELYLDAGRT